MLQFVLQVADGVQSAHEPGSLQFVVPIIGDGLAGLLEQAQETLAELGFVGGVGDFTHLIDGVVE